MKKLNVRRITAVLYAILITAMAFLFFTNDFGLVDIRKTAVIIGAGIDVDGEEVSVTAQVAIPQPSETGANTQYIEVEGKGVTVADALNVINKKTGFYPKLVFCKLLVLGESCSEGNIFEILDYFYRDDYTQLTPVVAMCEGSAAELLASKMRFGNTATVSVERLLSDEAKKSGNVSTVNLKIVGIDSHSPSKSCYMPYIRAQEQSAQGGEQGGGGSSSGQQSGDSAGSSGSSGGKQEFLCDRTAVFSDGRFAGVLTEEETFALNLLKNNVRHVFIPCGENELQTLSLRGCKGGVRVKEEGGVPEIEIYFSAVAQIADVNSAESPPSISDGVVPEDVLRAGERAISGRMDALVSSLKNSGCDALGFRTLLYRFHYPLYERYGDGLLSEANVTYKVNLRSAG